MRIDSPHPIPLVILATAWGPKFGGINAFNEELTRSLGIKADRAYDLICVVPRATEVEIAEAAHSCSVRLVVLGDVTKDGELSADMAAQVLGALNLSAQQQSRAVWVGHDDKTGPLAVALRDVCVGSKAVLIHHMAFGAYQDFKKSNSQFANDKREMQRALFKQADLCLAVGPTLQEQLKDLLRTVPKAPPVEMLVPGLAEPDPDHVHEQGDASSLSEALSAASESVTIYALLYAQMPVAYERNFGIASETLVRIANEKGLDGKVELQRVIDDMLNTEA
jgi:hypothetical protein